MVKEEEEGGNGERGGVEGGGRINVSIIPHFVHDVFHVPCATVTFWNNLGIPILSTETVTNASKLLACNL